MQRKQITAPGERFFTFEMVIFYTRCLQELVKMRISDVLRIDKSTFKTPSTKMDKGLKLYASSYIFNYEGS